MAFRPAQWDKQNGDSKRSRWRVSLWAQLNTGQCSLVGKGHPTLLRQYTPTEVTLPLLTQPAVAEATCSNTQTPLQGVARGSSVETTAAGQSLQQQGEPHISRAEPQQANSD